MAKCSGLLVFAMLMVPLAVGGCASYKEISAPPAQSQPIAVNFTNEGPNMWTEVPSGSYEIPNSTTVISGHQSGGYGFLFGVVGVLAQDAIETKQGEKAVGGAQDALRIDLVPEARSLTQEAIASGKFGQTFAAAPVAGGPVLTVSPYVAMTFVDDQNVRAYVVLKVALKGKGAADWSSHLFASAGKPAPLMGPQSFTADDGKLLKASTSQALKRALDALYDDINVRRPRDETKKQIVWFDYPYIRGKCCGGLPSYVLAEDDQIMVVAPPNPDASVMAGVYVLEKSEISRHPPDK
jgi:hypothetical protein